MSDLTTQAVHLSHDLEQQARRLRRRVLYLGENLEEMLATAASVRAELSRCLDDLDDVNRALDALNAATEQP